MVVGYCPTLDPSGCVYSWCDRNNFYEKIIGQTVANTEKIPDLYYVKKEIIKTTRYGNYI
tara:strand:+ start:588 stop:767 length:180 start_codon:yes stop_codon:yes gene_type:complete